MNSAALFFMILAFLSFFAAAVSVANTTQTGLWRWNWLAIGLACASVAVILQFGWVSSGKVFPT